MQKKQSNQQLSLYEKLILTYRKSDQIEYDEGQPLIKAQHDILVEYPAYYSYPAGKPFTLHPHIGYLGKARLMVRAPLRHVYTTVHDTRPRFPEDCWDV